jgi:lipoate-protein ligase A
VSQEKTTTQVIRSHSFDPWHNLALEEALLSDVAPNEVILYLWQNEKTVVIGRNQNAWKEARWKELEEAGGKLARRLSGGGAVYHDLGNLNFTFVMDKGFWDLHRQLKVILNAVKKLGVEAEFKGRNDIIADGRKFSGNAFLTTQDAALHHGTVLVDVVMEDMTRYLQVSEDKIQSKGVTSVQSRVVNLKELNPEITIDNVVDAMGKAFVEEYGGTGEELLPSDVIDDLSPLYEKFASWEWRYGRTPKFDVSYATRFDWGGVEVGFSLEDGKIVACTIYSDAMDSLLIQSLAANLEQIAFKIDAIQRKLDEVETDDETSQRIVQDLRGFLSEQQI